VWGEGRPKNNLKHSCHLWDSQEIFPDIIGQIQGILFLKFSGNTVIGQWCIAKADVHSFSLYVICWFLVHIWCNIFKPVVHFREDAGLLPDFRITYCSCSSVQGNHLPGKPGKNPGGCLKLPAISYSAGVCEFK